MLFLKYYFLKKNILLVLDLKFLSEPFIPPVHFSSQKMSGLNVGSSTTMYLNVINLWSPVFKSYF